MVGTESAERAVQFIRHLKHTRGKWAGVPFELLPWQELEVVRPLFGTLRPDGTRQYRTAWIEVPRKQGKTEIGAALALKFLFADDEQQGEVYSAAATRDQASLTFNVGAAMVRNSPQLSKRAKIIDSTKRIIVTKGVSAGSFWRAIPADAAASHGFSASAVIFDEVHVQPSRDLWDVLSTSQGAREQPAMIGITTAGYDRQSLCWELHEYARQVRAGIIEDPTFLSVIYGAAESDDWLDEAIWRKANPSLGVTVSLDFYRMEAQRAQQTPAYENTFRRLYLNQWTQQESRFIPMQAWDASGSVLPKLEGKLCFGGLDLASTTDLAAFVLVFPPDDPDGGSYHVLPHFWIPEENLLERSRRDRVPYQHWVNQGYITATPGNVIDYAWIKRDLLAWSLKYNLREIAFDPWGAVQLSTELADELGGVLMVPMRQGFQTLSAPTKELLRLVLAGRLNHGGNPPLRWMADSVMVETDAAGNYKPSKRKSTQRIDGILATVMGLDRAMRAGPSIYETRGILTL